MISLYLIVCKGSNPKRCGKIAQEKNLSFIDNIQYDLAKNDATCISKSEICDGCYDCQLGIDERNVLCPGSLMLYYFSSNV